MGLFGINTVSDISKFTKISRAAAAASEIWRVLKPCCFPFIPQGKEISHFTLWA